MADTRRTEIPMYLPLICIFSKQMDIQIVKGAHRMTNRLQSPADATFFSRSIEQIRPNSSACARGHVAFAFPRYPLARRPNTKMLFRFGGRFRSRNSQRRRRASEAANRRKLIRRREKETKYEHFAGQNIDAIRSIISPIELTEQTISDAL